MGAKFKRTKAEAIDMAATGHALLEHRDRSLQPHTIEEHKAFAWQYNSVLAAATLLTQILTEEWTPVMVASYTRQDVLMASKTAVSAGRAAVARWLEGGDPPYAADGSGMPWMRQAAA